MFIRRSELRRSVGGNVNAIRSLEREHHGCCTCRVSFLFDQKDNWKRDDDDDDDDDVVVVIVLS